MRVRIREMESKRLYMYVNVLPPYTIPRSPCMGQLILWLPRCPRPTLASQLNETNLNEWKKGKKENN